jgi:hypothetical protein
MASAQTKAPPMSKPVKPHDRRGLYGKDALPRHARFAAMEIEDPYSQAGTVLDDGTVDLNARLDQAQHRDGTIASGAPGWTPPVKPKITVIRSLKDDPLGRMHSRRQIDQAEFLAGRAYQGYYVQAQLSRGSSDMSNIGVDGGGIGEPLTEGRQRALQRLRLIDHALAMKHGSVGVLLVRDVLGEGFSIEAAARRRASVSERGNRSWGWLFRRCLGVIAFKLGYASTSERRRR